MPAVFPLISLGKSAENKITKKIGIYPRSPYNGGSQNIHLVINK